MRILSCLTSFYAISIVTFLASLLLFLNGFLLTRLSIETKNNCSSICAQEGTCPIYSHLLSHSNLSSYCQVRAPIDKLVLIVIDGLRYDFLDSSAAHSRKRTLKHKISAFSEPSANLNTKTSIYKFIADPPTTTMQRIKGITTGSLPTFIDISQNFASEEIREDNFIHQLLFRNSNVIFMGDELWVDLFPHKFLRSYPYPAVDVRDLDTVDNGVVEHLFPEISKDDWHAIVGHFLGVDHCGHTYGRDHSMMSLKLKQMDGIMKKLVKTIENLPEDVLLVVMGDHGMNANGDHGGDSQEEITSGLVLHSNSKLLSFNEKIPTDDLPQVSLVPTLSLIMGLPIPFGNTGEIIANVNYKNIFAPQITPLNDLPDIVYTLFAYEVNIDQVVTYLDDLSGRSSNFPRDEYKKLVEGLSEARSKAAKLISKDNVNVVDSLNSVLKCYSSFMKSIRLLCVKSWATFDNTAMFFSCFSAALIIILAFIESETPNDTPTSLISKMVAILLWILVVIDCIILRSLTMITYFIISLGVFLHRSNIIHLVLSLQTSSSIVTKALTRKTLLMAVFLCFCLSSFSNSFVINEDRISSYLVSSAAILIYLIPTSFFESQGTPTKNGRFKKTNFFVQGTLLLIFLMSVRFGAMFYRCREEQADSCTYSIFIRPISAIAEGPLKTLRYTSSICLVFAVFLAFRYLLRSFGNANGHSANVLITSYLHILFPVFLTVNWTIQMLPRVVLDRLPRAVQYFCPLSLLCYTLANLLCLLLRPLLIFVVDNSSEELQNFSQSVDPVRQIFLHLKHNWKSHFTTTVGGAKDTKKVVVYGLSTVYSAALLTYFICTFGLQAVLASDGLFIAHALQVISLVSMLALEASNPKNSCLKMILWFFACNHFFFATGHQHTIAGIPWDAAFTVWSGNFATNIIPATLILLNTYSSQIIFTSAIPLLVTLPPALSALYPALFSKKGLDCTKGDFSLHQTKDKFIEPFKKLFTVWILLHATKLVCVMTSAAVLCRHLMVWKIFAPRFMFEGVSFIVVFTFSTLTYLVVCRIHACLERWVQSLEKP